MFSCEISESSGGRPELGAANARMAFANFCAPHTAHARVPAAWQRKDRLTEISGPRAAQQPDLRPHQVELICMDDLKTALRSFAKSVTVISCAHSGERFAMTATAVSEVCLEPPTMLVCINKSASIAAPLIDESRFAINVLDRSQQRISEDCSGRKAGDDRFADQDWTSDHLDTPYLQSSQATIFCRVARTLEYGTHFVVFGEVQGVRANDRPTPLIYLDRRYLDASLDTTVP